MKTFAETGNMGMTLNKVSLGAIKKRRVALEAGLEEMEQGLQRLGIRIKTCRERLSTSSQKEAIAPLSLKKKLSSRDRALDLVESTRRIGFDTRAIERETRNNCRKLNELAEQLKDEVARRRALDKKRPKPALKTVSGTKASDSRPSAKILRFSPIKRDE